MDFVKKLMGHRLYWREANSNNTTLYNFKWQPTKSAIEYHILNPKTSVKRVKIIIINLLDGESL